LAKMIKFKFRY